MLLAATLLSFCAVAALVLALAAAFERDPVRERLARLRALATTVSRPDEARGILVDERTSVAGRALSALAGSEIDPSSPALAKVRQRLIQDWRYNYRPRANTGCDPQVFVDGLHHRQNAQYLVEYR